jgi:hypothetical protein
MITLCIMPNFKGTIKESIMATLLCLCLDAIYVVPMILDFSG